jgi:multiple sugar transport system ATP-binding protein
MAEIVLDRVTKVYSGGVTAVNDLSLDIRDEELMVLVGPSGCGKSTALRCIAGLEEITFGNIFIGDRVVNNLPPKDRDIAMVFQNYALYPHMTVEQNLAFGLQQRKTPKAEIKRRVNQAARMLGIEEYLNRKPAALSGGQRQRVAMGRAIVREPQAYLMDEPLSNLDAKLRVALRASLSQLHERLGVTTVYVTHDQVEAMTLGHRVCVLRDGKLQQVDTPQVLYDNPVNLFVAGFIGSPAMNFVVAELVQDDGVSAAFAGYKLRLPDETIDAKQGLRSYLGRELGGRQLAPHAGAGRRDGEARQRDPHHLHSRHPAGTAPEHQQGGHRGGGGRRDGAGWGQVAVDRAGRRTQPGAIGPAGRAGGEHLEPSILRPGQRAVHRAPAGLSRTGR